MKWHMWEHECGSLPCRAGTSRSLGGACNPSNSSAVEVMLTLVVGVGSRWGEGEDWLHIQVW